MGYALRKGHGAVIRALKVCWLCWRGLCCTLGLHWHVHYAEPGYVGYDIMECDCGHRKAVEQ